MNATKLHGSLAAALASPLEDEAPIPIIVRVRPGPLARGESKTLRHLVAKSEFRLLEARALEASSDDIAALTEDPAVDLIWPDLPVHTWLDDAAPRIRAPRVWESGFTGRGVKVAVLDTGLDPEHPDFRDRLREYRDFVRSGEAPADPNGHGTHVAGIAGGDGAGSDGRYRGIAPECQLLIARVLDASGSGRTSDVMAGLEWAVERGAQVVNVSLGGPPYPSDGTDALSTLCNAAVEAGVVVCVAAGNIGPSPMTIGAPAAAARVVTVGAAEVVSGGGGERVADFSSRGPTADGRAKPDLIFPGVGIVAPRSAGTRLGTPVDSAYTTLRGTSQATPMAAGVAALILQSNPRLNPEEVKLRLVEGARRLDHADVTSQGAGRGDAYNTFLAAQGTPIGGVPLPVPEESRPGCLPLIAGLFLLR